MMKIMYLLFSFTIGGTERLVSDICNEMVNKKQEVYLYIVNDLYSEELLKTLDDRVHIKLLKRNVGGEKVKTIIDITNYIRKNKIDVVHCNTFTAPELLLLKKFLFPKLKVVHTIHDVGQYSNLSKLRIAYRNIICDKFIAISETVKKDIIKHGANPDKVKLVYNAINLDVFHRSKIKIFDKRNVIIGNVARFMPEKKGQDVLINAISILKDTYPNIQCFFAGGYDSSHEKVFFEYADKINRLGLERNIVLLGNVTNIPNFLETLDIFVLPSFYEGFGISLIEAMSMGIPSIASKIDGPEEIIGDNKRGLLFEKGNSLELAQKISFIIENYDSVMRRQKEIQGYVDTNFNISSMCDELLKIYE